MGVQVIEETGELLVSEGGFVSIPDEEAALIALWRRGLSDEVWG